METYSYEARIPDEMTGTASRPPKVSVLVLGPPKSWKSTWAYQWPAPVVLNIVAEGGNRSIETYPQIAEYLCSLHKDPAYPHPPVFNKAKPQAFDIYFSGRSTDPENISRYPAKHCLVDAIEMIEANWKQWNVATVILDSVGFLQRLWETDLIAYRFEASNKDAPGGGPAVSAQVKKLLSGGKKDYDPNERWAERMLDQGGVTFEMTDYGIWNKHLQRILESINAIPCNRIIVGHEKVQTKPIRNAQGKDTGDREIDKITLALSGQSKDAVISGVDLIIQTELQDVTITTGPAKGRKETRPIFWTTPDKHSLGSVGHRFAFAFKDGKLLDPELGDMPTFRAVYYKIHEHIALPSGQ